VPRLMCVFKLNHDLEGKVMNNVTVLGIEFAKNPLSVHCHSLAGFAVDMLC
jgi:hypothetical protein